MKVATDFDINHCPFARSFSDEIFLHYLPDIQAYVTYSVYFLFGNRVFLFLRLTESYLFLTVFYIFLSRKF
jgi:hypothetical protein